MQPCWRTEPETAKISDVRLGRAAAMRPSSGWLRLSSQLIPERSARPAQSTTQAPTMAPEIPIASIRSAAPQRAAASPTTSKAASMQVCGSASTRPPACRRRGVGRAARASVRPRRSKTPALQTDDPASIPRRRSPRAAPLIGRTSGRAKVMRVLQRLRSSVALQSRAHTAASQRNKRNSWWAIGARRRGQPSVVVDHGDLRAVRPVPGPQHEVEVPRPGTRGVGGDEHALGVRVA